MSKQSRRGLFITFEGVEGAGKSTQIMKLNDWLMREQGRAVELTREPGGTVIGTEIREVLLAPKPRPLNARTELLLYAADRAQHVEEKIRPALESGSDVICDRYIHSTMAYQGFARGLDKEAIAWLNHYATGGLLPDLVILLDLDPKLGLARARKVGSPDRLEQEALTFHEKVRTGFNKLASDDKDRFFKVKADQSEDKVAQLIQKRVLTLMAGRQ